MHAIEQIRGAFVTALTGLSTTGPNVFPSRVYPSDDQSLPAICIFTLGDSVARHGPRSTGVQVREVTVRVEGRSKLGAADVIEDALDSIAEEIEAALGADLTLGGLVLWAGLASSSKTISDDLEVPSGILAQTWTCRYLVNASDPEQILNSPGRVLQGMDGTGPAPDGGQS
jgi:hypothetical protein